MGIEPLPAPSISEIGKQLIQNSKPSEEERILWRLLKESRRRQAIWRVQERQVQRDQITNPDGLSPWAIRKAASLWVSLKERKCSYGDYVFNFAFPARPKDYPKPIRVPYNLPKIIWGLATQVEKNWPLGLPMLRIDAIRQPNDTIRIIELNPCWVDNIAALQAFYEAFSLSFPNDQKPTKTLAQTIRGNQEPSLRGNLALTYCNQADGCKRDEIYGLSDYLETTDLFQEIVIAPLREVTQNTNGTILVKGEPVSMLYLNGSFSMAQEFIREEMAVQKIKASQRQNLLALAPAQFNILDQKTSLIQLSKQRPDLFIRTEDSVSALSSPFIAKPTRAESLAGIEVIENDTEIAGLSPEERYIFQPISLSATQGIICFDSKEKIVFSPPSVYEKINLWIIGNQLAGVIATYSSSPIINDACYNLPILWEEI